MVSTTEGRVQGVVALNALPEQEFRDLLLACCHAPGWAAALAAQRPFPAVAALLDAADAALATASEEDVDTAVAAHPRIGERPANAASRREQAAALSADAAVLDDLAAGNRAYEGRFGHVYLVCASGRSAEELLAVLRSRLDNDPVTERAVLRRELAAITRLRLERAVGDASPVRAGIPS
ncbi:2-oxo-4-hydroxy-4-carboxy-5-ureidoimidazoline decarboxylase [Kineococcus radiotolerans]|uniref:2-oxo-4-hydroxy-4-carboxy-5-ureidoimidazoline decarboxylase n=1 Tax=Kineococcus radiotolerans TaxID=131568 RepID=A0A7W4XVH3_KINRA|nr:2-oxo-4-hydroxy-4-carboxy-5-ureidoimidazoline decarboxylase [Kineococcus radiotolerans]MBB2899327.1 2-oxo-4-hydroxy-4-carboxy-5-ureidoimidazoline decarboxylase [Kineococcus radiotolerans]